MSDVNPMWLQAGTYEAREDRQVVAAAFDTEGIVRGYTVSPRGAGTNMSVDVGAGLAVVQGDDSPNQGMYVVENDTILNLPISAAPATGGRIDRVVVQVRDAAAGGATGDDALVTVVEGSPSAAPILPTVPPSALPIARVTVNAGMGAITAGNIDTASDATIPSIARWG